MHDGEHGDREVQSLPRHEVRVFPANTAWRVVEGVVAEKIRLSDGSRLLVRIHLEQECLSVPEGHPGYVALCDSVLTPYSGECGACSCNPAQEVWRKRLVSLGRLDAGQRIAAFLVDMAARVGEPLGKDGAIVKLRMSREDIADYLCLKPETISRVFTRLKRDGVVTLPSPTECVIPSIKALKALAPHPVPRSD